MRIFSLSHFLQQAKDLLCWTEWRVYEICYFSTFKSHLVSTRDLHPPPFRPARWHPDSVIFFPFYSLAAVGTLWPSSPSSWVRFIFPHPLANRVTVALPFSPGNLGCIRADGQSNVDKFAPFNRCIHATMHFQRTQMDHGWMFFVYSTVCTSLTLGLWERNFRFWNFPFFSSVFIVSELQFPVSVWQSYNCHW